MARTNSLRLETNDSRPDTSAQRLNWLRAGVLGANDGIVSVAAIAVGVAGVTTASGPIFTAGIAALIGGAISMALGEYVSVSGQRDGERAQIARVKARGAGATHAETDGASTETVGAGDAGPLESDSGDVVSPWHAAFASAGAFLVGGVVPLLAILLPPEHVRVPVTFSVVLIALAATGVVGAHLGGGSRIRAAVRVVIGGALALAATFTIGAFLGTSGVL
ncbi:MAG: VIT1/CCC1 transporter family protein [Microbacteriaceae bacterium]|nr:VIT1/CCC1 transporter family protein [Microbacteriaceae bacterium]